MTAFTKVEIFEHTIPPEEGVPESFWKYDGLTIKITNSDAQNHRVISLTHDVISLDDCNKLVTSLLAFMAQIGKPLR